ncbi:response regulator [Pontibacter sp. KCTC 32443]|uniref:response regulator n=1 Tax=Pontibacter TaxID=323449 RepID=UPI00164E7CA7|nr:MULTISPECIES: response regulator [Pontibacter]MBC5775412.1 response regulator [Pontibacter sp. KCTC 32443]
MYKLQHILIVDDDQINNLFSQIILEDANACNMVSVCQSTVEALELLRSMSSNAEAPFPDLILLDINMPELDGFDFLERYHMLGYNEQYNTAISMFSTSDDPDHIERVKQFNSVIGFIQKPLSMATLHNILTHSN